MSPERSHKPALITSARFGRTLDTNARSTRYLWTMAVRVACFLAALVTPLPWNLILLLAAAILPAIAVMLANAVDQRQLSLPPPEPDHLELPPAPTVGGGVEDDET